MPQPSPQDASPSTLGPGDGPPPSRLAPPRYLVMDTLGKGGMGAVYRALDTVLDRAVALKVIRPDALTAEMRQRFLDEARAVARLDHPHIVKVFDVGEWPAEGSAAAPYLTLELAEGGTLETAPPAAADAPRVVAQLARGMQHAHDRGVVHRDLKPANVLLTADGTAKISDFGLARRLDADQRLTRDGVVLGTPAYMAPEQADGRPDVGPKADVYALGVILYRLLSGRLPFDADSLTKLLHQIAHEPPPPLVGVAPALATICLGCLDKDPAKRPTAGNLAVQLEAAGMAGDTVPLPEGRRRRRWPWFAAGAAALVGLWLAFGPGPRVKEGPVDDPAAAPKVKSFRLDCYRAEGGKAVPLGVVSGDADEKALLALPFRTHVIVHAEFTAPVHAFLIAFNANGKPQLRWPVNQERKPDETVRPPRVERLTDPDPSRRGANGGPLAFVLDDEPQGGLQAFALVLSREPLPAFAEWRQGRDLKVWRRLAGVDGVFLADTAGVYPVRPGMPIVRGSEAELGSGPDLRPLCRALAAGADDVEVLAVPVEGMR